MGANISSRVATRAILDAVRRIVQALRESSRLAEKHVGLTGAQLFVLQQLQESPTASVNELAARAHTHQSSVSTVVSRLVDRGLVRRVRSGTDARSVELSLSARGRQAIARAPDLAQERLVQAIERLPARRRPVLAATLLELARAVDAGDRTPVMFFEERGRQRRVRARG